MVALADEITSLLRHELRNKFASVRNAGFYVKRRLSATEEWQADPRLDELSRIIQNEMQLASELLDQRTRLQHVFLAAPARVDGADCVRLAAKCPRVSSGCSVAIEVEAEPGQLMADPNELALALRCLIENAVEATDKNGVVHVRSKAVGERYVIDVTDSGPGIQEPERNHALQPFYTTKPGHTGLGLNIAKRIVERYAGSLHIRETSAGATVSLDLKLAEASV